MIHGKLKPNNWFHAEIQHSLNERDNILYVKLQQLCIFNCCRLLLYNEIYTIKLLSPKYMGNQGTSFLGRLRK